MSSTRDLIFILYVVQVGAATTGFISPTRRLLEIFPRKRHQQIRVGQNHGKSSILVVLTRCHLLSSTKSGCHSTVLWHGTWSEDLLLLLERNIPQEEAYFTFSYSAILDDAGKVGGIFCACYETTGRVLSERRLRSLRELDRAKTAFFSNVSHEFRRPLTLILGPLEDALANAHGILPKGAAADLAVAHRNSLRLLKLVNTLLDFSRIEAGRIQASYEPTDLAACTADLVSVFRSAIEKAGLALVVDCPALPEAIYVDREMWEKIVLNLLSNAFKFTFEGKIKVALRWRRQRVELCVSDTCAIREDEALRSTPVILLSARAGEEARLDGIQQGADDYLTKPFSARELLARVSTHLKLAGIRRQAAEEVSRSQQFLERIATAVPDLLFV
jgi:hypothetical protein